MTTRIIDNNNQTYSVEIDTLETGTYTTTLFYGGTKVPTNYKTTVTPSASAPPTPSTNAPAPAFAPKKLVPKTPQTPQTPQSPQPPQFPAPGGKPGTLTPADVAKVKVQGLEKSKN